MNVNLTGIRAFAQETARELGTMGRSVAKQTGEVLRSERTAQAAAEITGAVTGALVAAPAVRKGVEHVAQHVSPVEISAGVTRAIAGAAEVTAGATTAVVGQALTEHADTVLTSAGAHAVRGTGVGTAGRGVADLVVDGWKALFNR